MDNNQSKTNLQEAIVRTIAFFDLFSYPVTALQIWKYINVRCELKEALEILENMPENISSKQGLYFLSGREEIIKERMARYNQTDKKFKRALLIAKVFKFIPWIKMIAIGNIIGEHNLKDSGDIDLVIITAKKRIWLTRFFCVLITKILRLRPTPQKTRNKICLSFFISEEAMNLESLMMADDIYFIHWLAGLVPIFNVNNAYEKFISANAWLEKYLPNWRAGEVSYKRDVGGGEGEFYYDVVDMLVGGLEEALKIYQLKIMPRKLSMIMNLDTRVMANDQLIKLHINDRRIYYKKELDKKLNALSKIKKDHSFWAMVE